MPLTATAPAEEIAPRALDFRTVFQTEAEYVWRSLKRMGVYDADLEDLTHDVFLAVHRHLGDYDADRPLKPWLFGFAMRYAMRYREQARFRRERMGLDVDPVDLRQDLDTQMETAQARALVATALEEIPIERRVVFILAEIDGIGMPEIVAELKIPLNTGYSRLRLAREDFRRAVQKLLPGGQ